MLGSLKAWWRRSVTVDRPASDRDVSRVVIDHGDGRVDELFSHRNDTFGLAWICKRAQEEGMRQLTLTVTRPGERGGLLQVKVIAVPDWARRKLFRGVRKIASEFGWQGQCPQPHPSTAFR